MLGDFLRNPLEEGCRIADESFQGKWMDQVCRFGAEKKKQVGKKRDCGEMPFFYGTAPILEVVDEEEVDLFSSLSQLQVQCSHPVP